MLHPSPASLAHACEVLGDALAARPDDEVTATVVAAAGWTLALAAFPAVGDPPRVFLETWLTHPTGVRISRCVLVADPAAVRAALADPTALRPRVLAHLPDDVSAAEARAVGLIDDR